MACRASGKSTRQGRLNYVLDVAMPLRFAGFRLGRRTVPVRVKITGTTNAPTGVGEYKIEKSTRAIQGRLFYSLRPHAFRPNGFQQNGG